MLFRWFCTYHQILQGTRKYYSLCFKPSTDCMTLSVVMLWRWYWVWKPQWSLWRKSAAFDWLSLLWYIKIWSTFTCHNSIIFTRSVMQNPLRTWPLQSDMKYRRFVGLDSNCSVWIWIFSTCLLDYLPVEIVEVDQWNQILLRIQIDLLHLGVHFIGIARGQMLESIWFEYKYKTHSSSGYSLLII